MDAAFFRDWLTVAAAVVETQRDHLTQLDAAIGDADHGINMARGFGAVTAALAQKDPPTPGAVLTLAGVQKLGAAREGEKTMVDALAPAVSALAKALAEGAPADDALAALAAAAQEGAQATISMQALKGRASYLGPRSVGHEDPGAASMALILGALRDVAAQQAP